MAVSSHTSYPFIPPTQGPVWPEAPQWLPHSSLGPVFLFEPNPTNLFSQQRHGATPAWADGLLFAGSKVSKALTARLLAGPWAFVGNISCWALWGVQGRRCPAHLWPRRFPNFLLGATGFPASSPPPVPENSSGAVKKGGGLSSSRDKPGPCKPNKNPCPIGSEEELLSDCPPPPPGCSQLSPPSASPVSPPAPGLEKPQGRGAGPCSQPCLTLPSSGRSPRG